MVLRATLSLFVLAAALPAQRPDIVVIMLDDMGSKTTLSAHRPPAAACTGVAASAIHPIHAQSNCRFMRPPKVSLRTPYRIVTAYCCETRVC